MNPKTNKIDSRETKSKSIYEKWSIGLNAIFVSIIMVSITLVLIFDMLSFDSRWWDITVGLLVPTTLIAFSTGLIALIKYKDRGLLLYLSLGISALAILFLFTHSLFIND